MHLDVRHINDIYSTDDELLQTLEEFSACILTSSEDKNISTEIDILSAQYILITSR